jgi:hypothetical protein
MKKMSLKKKSIREGKYKISALQDLKSLNNNKNIASAIMLKKNIHKMIDLLPSRKLKKLKDKNFNFISDPLLETQQDKMMFKQFTILQKFSNKIFKLKIFKLLRKVELFRPTDKIIIIFESLFIFSIILQVIFIPVSIAFEKSIPDIIGN